MALQESESLLTPGVLALVGESTGVHEMYDVVDRESLRRFANAIHDQDPRCWDEDLAGPGHGGGTTTTPVLVSFIAGRQPPWAEDTLNDDMMENWFRDGAGRGRAADDSGRTLTPTGPWYPRRPTCTPATKSSCAGARVSETASSARPGTRTSRKSAAEAAVPC